MSFLPGHAESNVRSLKREEKTDERTVFNVCFLRKIIKKTRRDANILKPRDAVPHKKVVRWPQDEKVGMGSIAIKTIQIVAKAESVVQSRARRELKN